MANYTIIDDPSAYFQTKTYTGSAGAQSITFDGNSNLQPDWIWIKERGAAGGHVVTDTVRGISASSAPFLQPSSTGAETEPNGTVANRTLTSSNTNGFTLGQDAYYTNFNNNSDTYVSWNWKAGGTAPAITYVVKVVSDGGNKYRFDDFGTSAVTLDLQEGGTYTFDQSDSSNSGHPLRFSTTSNGSHGGGSEYTTGVTVTGTPGNAGAKTVITVASGAATLYYYCTQHSAMGGQANTNSTFGSSNFSGSIQSKVSASTISGFSIVTYTGTGANATIGHGLSSTPKTIITHQIGGGEWYTYHNGVASDAETDYLNLHVDASASDDAEMWNDTKPTTSVFSVGVNGNTNGSSDATIAYCFADVKGYSKVGGSFKGNGNADGTFIYLGFKPAWVMIKESSASANWFIFDTKRIGFNGGVYRLKADTTESENTSNVMDILSNGFKLRVADGDKNGSGDNYIYMAFAENPFVTSTGVPATAR